MSQQFSIVIIIVLCNCFDLVECSVKYFEQDSYLNKEILVVECGIDV